MDLDLRLVLLVAAGGALGSVLRYLVGLWLTGRVWPWGTLAVNLVGAFLVALLLFGALRAGWIDLDGRAFLVTGVLGGFTTMSSFAYETVAFVDDQQVARAATYAALTVGGCLAMAFLGRAAAALLVPR